MMSEQLSVIEKDIETIIGMVETILRGKTSSVNMQDLLCLSFKCYDFFSSTDADASNLSPSIKTKFLEHGVKLYNKIRNLTAIHLEIRSNLKATCAWIFGSFGESSSKVFSICLKLLAKCGEDFSKISKESPSVSPEAYNQKALRCYSAALSLWNHSEEIELYNQLPPLEVSEIRLSIFRCLLGRIRLVGTTTKDEQHPLKELKKDISKAAEMIPTFHLRYRLSLVELIYDIISPQNGRFFTSDLASSESSSSTFSLNQDVISYYTLCLDILEIPNDPKVTEGKTDDFPVAEERLLYNRKVDLSVRAYLSLAFLYAEMK
jgi:hypothetical protein